MCVGVTNRWSKEEVKQGIGIGCILWPDAWKEACLRAAILQWHIVLLRYVLKEVMLPAWHDSRQVEQI